MFSIIQNFNSLPEKNSKHTYNIFRQVPVSLFCFLNAWIWMWQVARGNRTGFHNSTGLCLVSSEHGQNLVIHVFVDLIFWAFGCLCADSYCLQRLLSVAGYVCMGSRIYYATDQIVGKNVFQAQNSILLGHRIKQECTDLDLKICRPNTWTFKKYFFLECGWQKMNDIERAIFSVGIY